MSDIQFELVPSVTEFVQCEAFIALILGPVGSTKTTAGMAKIAYHAKRMAPCTDGVRRSRAIWVRNTREQLRDTSVPDFLKWYPDGVAGAYLKTEMKFVLKFEDVECEVLFRGLDDTNDVRRLLSLQASFFIFEEFREINPDVFNVAQTRIGRYPDGSMVPHRSEWGVNAKGNPIQGCVTDDGKPNMHVWGMSNPPDSDSFWERLISEPPENVEAFVQPSGMSDEADWLHFLPSDYYENMCKGKTDDWIDVYVHAKFGKNLSGMPVFRCFDRDLHVAKEALKPNGISTHPILIGFDCTGLNPACVIGQLGFSGKLQVFDALHSSDMGPLRFVKERLKPLLANKYPGMPTLVVIDPAGMNRESDERSVRDMLVAEGFAVKPAKTNNIAPRISAVEQFMTRLIDGKPAFVVDPGCTDLITALRSKYRYKVNSKGDKDDKPDKNHPYADIVDSLQYLCLHADGGAMFGGNVMSQRREVKPAPVRWAVA